MSVAEKRKEVIERLRKVATRYDRGGGVRFHAKYLDVYGEGDTADEALRDLADKLMMIRAQLEEVGL